MLLEANRHQDLSLLYDLFIRFKNGLGLIKKAFANYIKVRCGMAVCGVPYDCRLVHVMSH